MLAHVSVNTFNEYLDFKSEPDLITKKIPFSGGSGALPQTPEMAGTVLTIAARYINKFWLSRFIGII